uniref:Transmembrane protein n=1 Tax=Fagus sylvatica TaxID=28930 RepID=A0A2N9IBT7_FAGSY
MAQLQPSGHPRQYRRNNVCDNQFNVVPPVAIFVFMFFIISSLSNQMFYLNLIPNKLLRGKSKLSLTIGDGDGLGHGGGNGKWSGGDDGNNSDDSSSSSSSSWGFGILSLNIWGVWVWVWCEGSVR